MTLFSSYVKRSALFHRWKKVIYRILLFISLTSSVCGTFVVNVTQTSYQAEENHNITLEWMFTTKPGSSLHSLYIYCQLLTDLRASGLFHLHGGVEVPESQDEQFTGRVQCDKDVLREGRLRLHVSRLRTDDSGLYMCDVLTNYGSGTATCRLNVTGTFVVNVTQTSYQAEENHNITLEWMFTTKPGSSLHSLYIYCQLLTDLRASGLFHLHGGVEVPESQDEQFTGRVQCDKDVLREGRLRLHVSRLRTDDSGLYMCQVDTRYGGSTATCRLNVTVSLQPGSRGRIGLYVGLGLAAALLFVCVGLVLRCPTGDPNQTNHFIRIRRVAVDLVNILGEEVVVVDKNNHSKVDIDNGPPEETVM